MFGRSQRDASSPTVAPRASTTHSCASTSQPSSLLAEADRLISSLRKGTTSAVGRRLKHSKQKTDAHVDPPKRKTTELQRQIIVMQYQGASSEAEETTSLHDKDIVVDGFIRFPSSADEDIRFEIADHDSYKEKYEDGLHHHLHCLSHGCKQTNTRARWGCTI